MLLKPLTIAAAGLAATTQAFLLPPEISAADIDIIETLPIAAPTTAESQVLKLDCPNCPPLFKFHHGVAKVRNGPSHLELAFTVDHEHNADRLLLNGFELFPNSDPFNNVLTAAQVPDAPESKKHRKEHKDKEGKALQSHHKWRPHNKPQNIEQPLGFSLGVRPVAKSPQSEDDQLEFISIDLQIIEVGNSFVDDIPNIHISLLRAPGEKLMIGNIETTDSQSPSNPMDKQEECTTFICKWKAILADHVKPKKHCGGMKGHHHHQGAPMYRHRTHSWGKLFQKLTHHIVIPVLVGIVAGVSVSIIGMIVGTLVVGLWRKFVRGQSFFVHGHCRRHARHAEHKAAHKEAVVEEEKSGLMEHQDPPPSYEDEETKIDA
ncbi:hypothetical protein UCRPA7_2840 [Phaeoacremonium minimum UCRPA7]|uniref:DUF7728 domain-containing protein n=1 Tax=Phaeoacremonium minimum (strain UCR-PA7) TaxID=1286976 RepID=R8BQI0_PHAM7|nr:hypothetical protein UCRPA7_2840 [Phaeoacremonium minimum UCRPA7]EOO01616.1 hypothetical protein UCRPA7_2840 [Phaeoacremonium minimum UCRPA7]